MGVGSAVNVAAYLESWGLELAARQNRIRHLIGDAHWLSDGHHKESILREFLTRYLPSDAECSTGFVRGASSEKRCSPEIDILLFNRRLHIPYLSEAGISIVDPSCVLATIEVKSSFSTSPLDEAIANIKAVRGLTIHDKKTPSDLWSGLFFYDLPTSRTLESAVQTLGERLQKGISREEENLMPTCVVLGQNCLAFPSAEQGGIRIRSFEGKGSAFASAICDLLALISSQVDGLPLSGFDEWGTSGEFRMIEKNYQYE